MVRATALGLVLAAAAPGAAADDKGDDGFVSLFNGTDLTGWKAAENPDCGRVEDGELVVGGGPRGHLFYVGDVNGHDFKNFELKLKAKIVGRSNSGVYFHTAYQESGWPDKGFECQVCSDDFPDPRKTGSLYAVKDVKKSPVEEGEWFDYHVTVRGDTVTLAVNGQTTVEWTQPDGYKHPQSPGRKLGRGTFALQCHDPKSVVRFKDIQVKVLPD